MSLSSLLKDVRLASGRAQTVSFSGGAFLNRIKGGLLLFTLFLSALAVSAQSTNAVQNPAQSEYRTDRILVKPKPGVPEEVLARVHANLKAKVSHRFEQLDGLQVVTLPPGLSVMEAVGKYKQSGEVEFAEPDYLLYPTITSNDPKFADGTLWALHNTGQNGGVVDADIDAPAAWDAVRNVPGVVVAVIDSGIRLNHEDLAGNLWVNTGETGTDLFGRDKRNNGVDDDGNGYVDDVHGMNAVNYSGNPTDDMGHGTHVAGIIGAVGNNGRGIVGVAWKVQLMTCKFITSDGNGATSDAIRAIDYARSRGAKIINSSWGSTSYSISLENAIRKTRDAGIIFVAAAGNDGQNSDTTPFYPAGYNLDNIVSVGASTRTDALASYSNYGAKNVDLIAPGSSIYSTWHTSDTAYSTSSGTSMAAPYVAGAFALMRVRFPNETYKQLIDRLYAATDKIPAFTGKCVTGGRLNLQKALDVYDPAGVLNVIAAGNQNVSGFKGGPFEPGTVVYTLTNSGNATLNWSAANQQNWATLSRTSGSLVAGASVSITNTINANANNFSEGSYTNLVTFSNLSVSNASTNLPLVISVHQWATLSAGTTTEPGQFQVRLAAEPGQLYVIETSTDLVHWVPIHTNTVSAEGALNYTDGNAVGSRRFYRAVAAPK